VVDDVTSTPDSYTVLLLCVGGDCSFRRLVRIRKLLYDDNEGAVPLRCLDEEPLRVCFVFCSQCTPHGTAIFVGSYIGSCIGPFSGRVISFPSAESRHGSCISTIQRVFNCTVDYCGSRYSASATLPRSVGVVDLFDRYREMVRACADMRSCRCRVQIAVCSLSPEGQYQDLRVSVCPPLDTDDSDDWTVDS
jgi:hypothetical protein